MNANKDNPDNKASKQDRGALVEYGTSAVILLAIPAAALATPTEPFAVRSKSALTIADSQVGLPGAQQVARSPEIEMLMDGFALGCNAHHQQGLVVRTTTRRPHSCLTSGVNSTNDTVFSQVRALPDLWQPHKFAGSFGEIMKRQHPYSASLPSADKPPGHPIRLESTPESVKGASQTARDGAAASSPPDGDTVTLRLRLNDRTTRRSVPYESPEHSILFRVVINGRPATALLDNGAARTIIDAEFAKRAGIDVRQNGRPVFGTAGVTSMVAVATAPILLEAPGTFSVSGSVVATDLSAITSGLQRPVDAVLGRDVLDHFAVTILPDAHRMLFHLGGSVTAMAGTTVLPISSEGLVAGEIGGQPVRLKVDLGFNGFIRLSDAAWRRTIPADAVTTTSLRMSIDGGTQRVREAIATIQLGNTASERIAVSGGYTPQGTADGLLGNGFLSRTPVVLDLKGKQLLLLPPQKLTATPTKTP